MMRIDRERLSSAWRATWTLEPGPGRGDPLRWALPGVFGLLLGVAIGAWGWWEFELTDEGALPRMLATNVFISLVVAYCIFGLATAAWRLVGAQRLRHMSVARRNLLTIVLVVAGVAVGWPVAVSLLGVDLMSLPREQPRALRFIVGLTLLVVLVMAVWFAGEARRHEAERRASEARLRLLQGQIEPHFLFNTLANVLSLMDHDTPRAKQLLETFIDYLRASLVPLRREQHTLQQELELVEAYLQLLQMRMGERLRYRIDAEDGARRQTLPPLLLQPLVENAIHHGLEPKIDGGEVAVRARVEDGRLVIEVRDDGLGLQSGARATLPRSGSGTAVANIRERLAGHYGPAASLSLQQAEPGTLARLELPL